MQFTRQFNLGTKIATGVSLAWLLTACTNVVIYQGDTMVRGYIPEPKKAVLASHNAAVLNAASKYPSDPPHLPHRIAPDGLAMLEEMKGFHQSEPKKSRPPKLCLALSGGGLRSAAFSIGVMKALHGRAMLEQVEAISAVSGGAYALSWYYAQHLHNQGTYLENRSADGHKETRRLIDNELFGIDGPSKYQTHLSNQFSVFSTPEYLLMGLGSILLSPANLFANGVFGWHANTTFHRAVYEAKLQALFHSNGAGDHYVADSSNSIKLAQLGRFAEGKLPYFIINTTALIEDNSRRYGASLKNAIFEFTPKQFGSDAFGRFQYARFVAPSDDGMNISSSLPASGAKASVRSGCPGRVRQSSLVVESESYSSLPTFDPEHPCLEDDLTLARVASISGAALDGADLVAGPSKKTLWSVLNLDLGYYLPNPGLKNSYRGFSKMLPLGMYFASPFYTRDIDSTDIYLSDGGHSENLGVFSLVRRLCESIIVVDAEHDPNYMFEGYRLLKASLAREMNVDITIDEIDGPAANSLDALGPDPFCANDPCSTDGAADKRTDCNCIRSQQTWKVSGEYGHVDQACPESAPTACRAHDVENGRFDFSRSPRWKYFARHPVMKGKICCLSYQDTTREEIDVTYIKLAFHPKETGSALTDAASDGCFKKLADFWTMREAEAKSRWADETPLWKMELLRYYPFPQDPTTDQSFERHLYEHYRDLGFAVTSAYRGSVRNASGKPPTTAPTCADQSPTDVNLKAARRVDS